MTHQTCTAKDGDQKRRATRGRAHGYAKYLERTTEILSSSKTQTNSSFWILVVRASSNRITDLAPHIPQCSGGEPSCCWPDYDGRGVAAVERSCHAEWAKSGQERLNVAARKMPPSGHSADAYALARKHDPVRLGCACPTVRPGAIAQIKARTALLIVEGTIHDYGAGLWIEHQHK